MQLTQVKCIVSVACAKENNSTWGMCSYSWNPIVVQLQSLITMWNALKMMGPLLKTNMALCFNPHVNCPWLFSYYVIIHGGNLLHDTGSSLKSWLTTLYGTHWSSAVFNSVLSQSTRMYSRRLYCFDISLPSTPWSAKLPSGYATDVLYIFLISLKEKLRGFGPLANYVDRATAACWRSEANFCE
jgi:hypothetical protein